MKEMKLQKLPLGIQTFEELRTCGYAYVDKTEHIYRMAMGSKYYFLSRPRRFGKSLLISTLKAFYLGKRELFEGLAIAKHDDVKWEEHPVFHLDLNTGQYEKKERLERKLDSKLSEWESLYGMKETDLSFGSRFENVMRSACEKSGRKVVVLVDEYDKPLQEAIDKRDLQDEFRSMLKDFYSAMKSADEYIEFAMLTGVTKFGKVSVFSGLNNLKDISMLPQYYDICGLTESELLECFPDEIERLAVVNDMTREQCVEELRVMYDGYHFEENSPGVYNPFSVLNTLQDSKFGSYWFDTATPSFLAKLLQKHDYELSNLDGVQAKASDLSSVDSESSNPIPFIYQTGYLTIKDYDPEFKTFILGFPNKEVKEGFVNYLAPFYVYPPDRQSPFNIDEFVRDVRRGDTEQFMKRLTTLFKSAQNDLILDRENHFHSVLWLLYTLMGFYTRAEYKTCDGAVDLVVKTQKYCYVMEFKYDGTAEDAMRQIEDKGYALPFELDGQQVVKVGVNFSSATRNIEKYIVKDVRQQ